MIHDQWQTYLSRAQTAPDSSAGLAYVPELAVVTFRGSDVWKFLQGYLTCDTGELSADTLTPTALCNLKGRVVMNGWCAATAPEEVTLVLHSSLVETVQTLLAPYLNFSRTRFQDCRDEVLVLAGLDLDAAEAGLAMDSRRRLFPCSSLDQARALWTRLPHLTAGAWSAALTADGIPLVSAPVSGAFLPQMLNLEALGAISFDKGCYLGQEVVARAQHRGQVKRQLARLTWQGAAPPAPGDEVTDAGGRVAGVVLQAAVAAEGHGPALAVLRPDAPGTLQAQDRQLSRTSP